MKRIKSMQIALYTILSTMMLLFVACDKTPIDDNSQREEGVQTLTIPTLSKDTKAAASIAGNTIKGAWEVGDELLITGGNLGASEEAIFVVKNAADIAADGTAIFTAESSSTPYVDPESATDVTVSHKSGTMPASGENNIVVKSDASHIPFSLEYTGTLSDLLSAGGFEHQLPYLKLDATFLSTPSAPKMSVQLSDESSNSFTYNLDLSEVITASQLSYSCFFALYNNDLKYTDIAVTLFDGTNEISSENQTLATGDIESGSLFNFIPTATITYDVTFNNNGGEGTMTAQTIEEGVATALSTNTFTRTDYTFSGWNTESNGSGTSYADGADITLSASVTLYAQWTEDTIAPTDLYLANIDADNIPSGDTWTILDTDATAESDNEFLGLCAALKALDDTRTINLVFPNLKTLPDTAICAVNSGCKMTINAPELITIGRQALYKTTLTSISAPKVTTIEYMALATTQIETVAFESAHTIGDEAFGYSNYFKEINLPKLAADTSGQRLFINSSNIEAITVATEGRAEFNSWNQIFLGLDDIMSNITLTSHISNLNVEDKMYKYQDSWEVGPFKAVVPIGTIEVIKVTGVTLGKTSLTLDEGASEILIATVAPDNAANRNVTWESDDDTVATVNTNGEVTGVAAGTATITVTTEDGSKTATCEVTVSEAVIEVTKVEITGYSPLNFATPSSTPTRQLTAVLTPSNADNKKVTWSSKDETVATVDENGLVTAKGAGYTEIIANTDDGPYDKVDFTVTGNNGHYDVVLNEYDNIIEYLIYSAQGLLVFKKQTESQAVLNRPGYDATLKNDIDMSSIADWMPIFKYHDYATFDGGGYTISNLKSTEGGLFKTLNNGAVIKNLTISAPNIKCTTDNIAVGAIVGSLHGSKVEKCAVVGGTVEGVYHTGGVVGYAGGSKIYGSYSTASVRGGESAGGLVGVIDASNVAASYSTGSVSAASDAGGFIGRYAGVGSCQVDGCFTTSKVYSDTEYSLGSGGAFGFTNSYQPNYSQGCYWVDIAADDDAKDIAVAFSFDDEYYALYEVTASDLNKASAIDIMNTAIANATIVASDSEAANVPYRFKAGSNYPVIYIP